ncbi:MAG: DUF4340 domain-containing protein [Ruminococcaceae bacterium]|nr:DUF4340 domain-containing protein [Oscillospiraceae bacterium]
MKKQKVTIILVIALLLLGVVSFGIYSFVNSKDGGKTEEIELFSCVPSAISVYSVKDGENEYTLVKKDSVWSVEGNEVAVLDQKLVQEIVNSASLIVSQGKLKERELKEFEMTGVQSLEIKLENGMSFKVTFLGQKGETCVARVNGKEELYVLRKSVRDILVADLDKLRVSLVFEGLGKSDAVLTSYRFVDYDGSETRIRTKNAQEISRNGENRYIMDAPYKKDVDDEKFEQQIVVRIPAIATTKYVDDFPDNLADYGLDRESRAVLSFRWGEKEEVLYLGAEESGMVHAVKEGKDGVFVINASQLEFLRTEPFYLLESGILRSEIENVSKITVETGKDTFVVTRSADKKFFYVNGKTASEAAFGAVAERLGDLELLSEVIDTPENKRDVCVTVVFDNGTASQNISLSKINDKEYAAFINGTAEFTVAGETVDELLEELRAVNNNPMKTDEKG